MELSDEEIDQPQIGEHYESDENRGHRSDEAEEDNTNENDDETKRRVDPKTSQKVIIRNPQPKLNIDRIQGPKGVQTIEKYFEGFKFHGKGREKEDLNRVMKRLEHWAHRLFPKYGFDDFLARMEVLGTKKNVQVFVKKYRLNMLSNDIIEGTADGEPERGEELIEQAPVDDFDLLIAEQIEKQRANEKSAENSPIVSKGNVLGTASSIKAVDLSEDVKARIEENRKLAMERKLARAKRLEEEKKRKLEELGNDSPMFNEEDVDNSQNFNHISELRSQVHKDKPEVGISSRNPEATIDLTMEESQQLPEIPKNQNITEKQNSLFNEAMEILTPALATPTMMNVENFPTSQNNNMKEAKEISTPVASPGTTGSVANSSDSLNNNTEEAMEICPPVLATTTTHGNTEDFPTTQNAIEDAPDNTEKLLTREELLMAIDGAMEEIIAGKNC